MIRLNVLFCFSLACTAAPHRASADCFQSDGLTIHYYVQGKSDGEPVVFLHGWLGNGNGIFDFEFSKRLIANGFRLVALDQRGHGQSDKPHDVRAYGVEMVNDVVRLLDHLDIRGAHVVGYSMGGYVATRLLVDHPDRVKSAVIGANGGFRTGDYAQFVEAFSSSVEGGAKTGDALIVHYHLAGFGPLNDELMREFPKLNETDAKALSAAAQGWKGLAVSARELRNIRLPTLVIQGETENAFGLTSAREFRELVPNCRFIVVKGHDHNSTLASPEFSAEVPAFLDEVVQRKTVNTPNQR